MPKYCFLSSEKWKDSLGLPQNYCLPLLVFQKSDAPDTGSQPCKGREASPSQALNYITTFNK